MSKKAAAKNSRAGLIKYLVFASPLFRFFLLLVAVLIFVSGMMIVSRYSKAHPVIYSVEPPVATGGEIVTIEGKGFSNGRGMGFVEIGGSSITESGYIIWTDTRIVLRLPPNVKDGLVAVVTAEGRSEPKIFANSVYVPQPVRAVQTTVAPQIARLSAGSAATGRLLVITGENFGDVRNESVVRFTAQSAQGQPRSRERENYALPKLIDFDYESWSDTEIRVRIPDGAASGVVNVVTDKGASNTEPLVIASPIGGRTITDTRIYLVNVSADISNLETDGASSIILRVPRPIVNSFQPNCEMRVCSPAPVIEDYNNMVIHQMQTKTGISVQREKAVFSQDFLINVNGISTQITESKVQPYTDKARLLYKTYTASDALVRSDNADIAALAREIVGRETNPYIQARLIYNYMLDTFALIDEARSGDPSALDMLDTKRGDAYDFAVVFASLCRAAGIPCVPVAGVFIEGVSLNTRNHWWNYFYIEDFGWIPVDTALGKSAGYGGQAQNPRAFYFGSIDPLHIAFSNGWKAVKPSLVNSKSVYRPRSYAFQSIWEEASPSIKEYSSFWNDPAITAMY
jgi:transglutaminase-like putative cysteine protease